MALASIRRLILAAATIASFPGVLSAQAPRIAPRASVVFAQSAPEAPADSLNLPETHWKEGFLVGGIGLGLFGAYAGHGFCEMSEESYTSSSSCIAGGVVGFLIGGLIGGVTGGMIGGLFPKAAPTAQPAPALAEPPNGPNNPDRSTWELTSPPDPS
jgi:hypothetical protein